MIKLILAATLALSLALPAEARKGDDVHLFGSIMASNFLINAGATKQQALTGCLIGGSLKEGVDALGFGTVDPIDMAINVVGCVAGVSRIAFDKPINKKYCRIGAYKGEYYGNRPECKACKADKTC